MEPLVIILGMAGVIFVMFVFAAIWASRYTKVGPNQALIVSGRQRQLEDGSRLGYRIVKGGGTFVWPVFEQVEMLSLEVTAVDLPMSKVRIAKGERVDLDCAAQVRIKGDDASIAAAAEHFSGKSDIKEIVRPIIEKHVRTTLSTLTRETIEQETESCAAKAQTASAAELAPMGLGVISFTIRDCRAG